MSLDKITLLSPHRDDAAFSLGVCLLRWGSLRVPLTIVNFFTETAYGPRMLSCSTSTVSVIRQREDRNVLLAIGRQIRIKAAGLLDAPLRLHISPASVCDAKFLNEQDAETLQRLGFIVRAYTRDALVLAPLGLGNHVDHLAVRAAALENCRASHLAMYEDLPYAIWTGRAETEERVRITAQASGIRLEPAIIAGDRALWLKRRFIRRYQSQIGGAEATQIARFGLNYRGGERIWIPRCGPWRSFLNSYA